MYKKQVFFYIIDYVRFIAAYPVENPTDFSAVSDNYWYQTFIECEPFWIVEYELLEEINNSVREEYPAQFVVTGCFVIKYISLFTL